MINREPVARRSNMLVGGEKGSEDSNSSTTEVRGRVSGAAGSHAFLFLPWKLPYSSYSSPFFYVFSGPLTCRVCVTLVNIQSDNVMKRKNVSVPCLVKHSSSTLRLWMSFGFEKIKMALIPTSLLVGSVQVSSSTCVSSPAHCFPSPPRAHPRLPIKKDYEELCSQNNLVVCYPSPQLSQCSTPTAPPLSW